MDALHSGILLLLLVVSANSLPRKSPPRHDAESFIAEGTNEISSIVLQAYADRDRNVAFSPLGYSTLLAILAEGAGGETRHQLETALHLPSDRDATRRAYLKVLDRLKVKNTVNKPELRSWFYVYRNYTVEDQFKEILKEYYLTEVKSVDRNEYTSSSMPMDFMDKVEGPMKEVQEMGADNIVKPMETISEVPIKTELPTDSEKPTKNEESVENEKIKNEEPTKTETEMDVMTAQKPMKNDTHKETEMPVKAETEMSGDTMEMPMKNEKPAIGEVPLKNEEQIDREKPMKPEMPEKVEMPVESEKPSEMPTKIEIQKENEKPAEVKIPEKSETPVKPENVNKSDTVMKEDQEMKAGGMLEEALNLDAVAEAHRIEEALKDSRPTEVTSGLSANNIVSKAGTKADSQMLAFNGLYFQGRWAVPFRRSKETEAFYKSDSQKMQIPMMEVKGKFSMGKIAALDSMAIELPYEGGRYSLLVVLPNARGGLPQLVSDLSVFPLRDVYQFLTPGEVDVFLPSFQIETITKPILALSKFGVSDLFNPKGANLSGISKTSGLYVDDLAQMVTVKVDEDSGSFNEFSAFNAAPRTGAERFVADRPFLFFVRDCKDKTILVAGKVEDPAQLPSDNLD